LVCSKNRRSASYWRKFGKSIKSYYIHVMTKEKEYTRFITDPVMEPYFISMDDSCMTVNIRVTPDARYTDSTKEYTKILGHYSNINSALKAIVRDKINSESYDSLKGYMDTYENITEQLNQVLNK